MRTHKPLAASDITHSSPNSHHQRCARQLLRHPGRNDRPHLDARAVHGSAGAAGRGGRGVRPQQGPGLAVGVGPVLGRRRPAALPFLASSERDAPPALSRQPRRANRRRGLARNHRCAHAPGERLAPPIAASGNGGRLQHGARPPRTTEDVIELRASLPLQPEPDPA